MGRSRTPGARMSPETPETPETADLSDGRVGRRALLRRAATVAAAGIGGVAATEMLSAGSASAATGDPVEMGLTNDGGSVQTTLSSDSTTGSTFMLTHDNGLAPLRLKASIAAADFADTGGLFQGGELINLTESLPSGGTTQALFWMTGTDTDTKLENLAVVLTTSTGTVFAPVGPTRLLDTRTVSGRSLLASTSVLDSSNRLLSGKILELKLGSFVKFAYAIHFNLTATGALGGGFLTAFGSQHTDGTPALPLASNLNYPKTTPLANSGLSPLSDRFSLFIYASVTTHIVLDVQGYTLPDFSFLLSNDPAVQGQNQKLSKTSQSTAPSFVRRAHPRAAGN
jgi:hypothetical protein